MIKDVALCELESARLHYKPVTMKHATADYIGWLNDPDVNKYLEVKKENTISELEEYIQNTVDKKIFFWAIHLKKNGKHIGNIKIDPINNKHGIGEYGIMIGDKNEWGNGFAKEASSAIIDFCFNKMNLRKMTLGVIENNLTAVKLYEKIGFVIEGNFKKHAVYNGGYCNILRMAIFNPLYF